MRRRSSARDNSLQLPSRLRRKIRTDETRDRAAEARKVFNYARGVRRRNFPMFSALTFKTKEALKARGCEKKFYDARDEMKKSPMTRARVPTTIAYCRIFLGLICSYSRSLKTKIVVMHNCKRLACDFDSVDACC